MKLTSKELKHLIAEYEDITSQESELAAKKKALKARVMSHLEATNSESVAVGDITCRKKVSSHSFGVTLLGVKVAAATNDLIKKLLADNKTNLLSINAKATLLHQLQEEKDPYTLDVLKGLGLEVVENHTLEIK